MSVLIQSRAAFTKLKDLKCNYFFRQSIEIKVFSKFVPTSITQSFITLNLSKAFNVNITPVQKVVRKVVRKFSMQQF